MPILTLIVMAMLCLHILFFSAKWLKPKIKYQTYILFFDGVCGLCNKSVDLILKNDKIGIMKFSPLQGETAKNELSKNLSDTLATLFLKTDNSTFIKSDAALLICNYLGGRWRILTLFKIFPKVLRDRIYDLVAKNRYRWFGKSESCRLPKPDEANRFLK